MRLLIYLISVSVFTTLLARASNYNGAKWPTVGISVLVRNKAHCLPYFFSCLDRLDYPKNRMYIWISSDHNQDKSDNVIDYWVALNERKYNRIYVKHNESTGPSYEDENSPTQWTKSRFHHVIGLRENAMLRARKNWADFHFMLDADVYLTNPYVLKNLIKKNHPLVAPMLQSEGMYSNFWAAMTERKYYKRSQDYVKIREKEEVGCFDVPMVHSAVLMNMNHPKSDYLTYDDYNLIGYEGPLDDIIIFAVSADVADLRQMVCNDDISGYIHVPLNAGVSMIRDIEQLINIKVLALSEGHEVPLSPELAPFAFYPEPSKYGLDEIYLINLERRESRREYMEKCFKELGMNVKFFKAFDGLTLDLDSLPFNIKLMPDYQDPYHKRPMKTGEIGCFLSHYKIWEEVAQRDNQKVLILEDDVFFRPYFRLNMRQLIEDIKSLTWDLVYVGRKILVENEETKTSQHTVSPHYSYWTLGYLLNSEGARKLLAAKPLENMLPVDEFLPIMFDKHPNDTWKSYFPERNLIALSANPLLIEPVRYVNQPGYISDTEESAVVDLAPGTMHDAYPAHAGLEYLEPEGEIYKPGSPEVSAPIKIEL